MGINDVPVSLGLAFNPAMLDRRPVRLLRNALDDGAITAICTDYPTVAPIGSAALAPLSACYWFGSGGADKANALVVPKVAHAGCKVNGVG